MNILLLVLHNNLKQMKYYIYFKNLQDQIVTFQMKNLYLKIKLVKSRIQAIIKFIDLRMISLKVMFHNFKRNTLNF
jgi:hypothetical protein